MFTNKFFLSIGILAAIVSLYLSSLMNRPSFVTPNTSLSQCVQPPSNVDHATFTDVQLDLYGLPHQKVGEPLAHWQHIVRSSKHRVCKGTPIKLPHHNLQYTNKAAIHPNYDEGTNIWAGNIAINKGYTEAIGQWNVPCLKLLLQTGYSYSWVGLGGDGNDGGGYLIQSGSASDEESNFPGHWYGDYFAWYEDYNNDPNAIYAFGVNCGDAMYSDDWQDYSGGKAVKAHMYILDEFSGTYTSAYNTQAFSNGSTAEWILERPTGDLADFRSVTFSDCLAWRYGSPLSPINLPHNYSTMIWNGHTLATVGPLYPDSSDSGANFIVNWVASH